MSFRDIANPSDRELRLFLDDGTIHIVETGTLFRLLAFCVGCEAISLTSKTTREFANAAEAELNRRLPNV